MPGAIHCIKLSAAGRPMHYVVIVILRFVEHYRMQHFDVFHLVDNNGMKYFEAFHLVNHNRMINLDVFRPMD
jgi:hypothetical protein